MNSTGAQPIGGWHQRCERAGEALRAGRLDELVELVVPLAREVSVAPVDDANRRLRGGSLLQAAYRFTGRRDLRELALDLMRPTADHVAEVDAAITARALMGTIHLLDGSYHRCVEFCAAAVALAEATGHTTHRSVALAHQFLGYVAFEWARFDEAERELNLAWDLAGPEGRGVRSGVARVQASLAMACGDRAGAERWLSEVARVVREPMTLRNREWLRAVRARITLGAGDLRAVEDWLRGGHYAPGDLAALDDAWVLGRLSELETVMSLLEATSQWGRGLAVAKVVARPTAGCRRWFHARASSVAAVCAAALGRESDARHFWDEALEAGRKGSFVWSYLEGSDTRRAVLRSLAAEGDARAARVLDAGPPARPPGASNGGLTRRQLDVLRLVERGHSNKAIARRLRLSMSTVKTHLREAFSRLEAGSRTEAVARARDRGLL